MTNKLIIFFLLYIIAAGPVKSASATDSFFSDEAFSSSVFPGNEYNAYNSPEYVLETTFGGYYMNDTGFSAYSDGGLGGDPGDEFVGGIEKESPVSDAVFYMLMLSILYVVFLLYKRNKYIRGEETTRKSI